MAVRTIKGRWCVDRRFDGKRHRIRSPENTRKGALAYERMLINRYVDTGSIKPPAKSDDDEEEEPVMTFAEFVKEWMEMSVRSKNKPGEYKRKESILQAHLLDFFGSMKLDEIGLRQMEAYRAAKLAVRTKKLPDGYSPKTINNQLSVLGRVLTCAQEWDLIQHVPRLKPLKAPQPEIRYLSDEEVDRLLEEDAEDWLSLMILMGLRTGMRTGEIRAIHWKDVDLNKKQLWVRYSASVGGQINSTKNNDVRWIPLVPSLYDRLVDWKLVTSTHASGLVFPSDQTGGVWSRTQATDRLKAIYEMAEIKEGGGWHTLRHTFATQLTAKGVSPRVIQRLLGHKSLKMTERYSHVSDDTLERAIACLEGGAQKFGHYTGTNEKVSFETFGLVQMFGT